MIMCMFSISSQVGDKLVRSYVKDSYPKADQEFYDKYVTVPNTDFTYDEERGDWYEMIYEVDHDIIVVDNAVADVFFFLLARAEPKLSDVLSCDLLGIITVNYLPSLSRALIKLNNTSLAEHKLSSVGQENLRRLSVNMLAYTLKAQELKRQILYTPTP